MRYAETITTIVLLTQPAVTAAPDMTVEGDGLELIAEYDLTGDTAERTVVDEAEMAKLEGKFPFKTFYYGLSGDKSYFVIFDDNGLTISYKLADSSNEVPERIQPLGDEGDYIKSTNFVHARYLLKEIYDKDDNLLSAIEEPGTPTVTESGKLIAFLRPTEFSHCGPAKVYRRNGDFVTECGFPVGGNIVPFDKNKDWFIASDPFNDHTITYSDTGTKVIDENGDLAFTLNPGVAEMVRSSSMNKFLYGSDKYICQIGEISALKIKGNLKYYKRPEEKHVNKLEVYDGEGNPLWSYEWIGEGFGDAFGSKIFVSDDESLIGLYMHSVKKLLVFDLETGFLEREIGVFWEGDVGFEAYISNDGGVILIGFEDRINNTNGYVVIYPDDSYSRVNIPFSDSDFPTYKMNPDGKFILAGTEDRLNLYKVTQQ
jgi:hypothetical protein